MTDAATFNRNLNKFFPPEKQRAYFGQVIACSDDGTRILAHAPTHDELFKELDRLNITDYVIIAALADVDPDLREAPVVGFGKDAPT